MWGRAEAGDRRGGGGPRSGDTRSLSAAGAGGESPAPGRADRGGGAGRPSPHASAGRPVPGEGRRKPATSERPQVEMKGGGGEPRARRRAPLPPAPGSHCRRAEAEPTQSEGTNKARREKEASGDLKANFPSPLTLPKAPSADRDGREEGERGVAPCVRAVSSHRLGRGEDIEHSNKFIGMIKCEGRTEKN